MTEIDVALSLGFKAGEVFTLENRVFDPKTHYYKYAAAMVGLEIDAHIKSLLIARDEEVIVPKFKYASYDFEKRDVYFDIKSFSKKSVSVSEREIEFADSLLANNKEMIYVVFDQSLITQNQFSFVGLISYRDLVKTDKIYDSLYSGMYFTMNDPYVSKMLMFS